METEPGRLPASACDADGPLLAVDDLRVRLRGQEHDVHALQGVSFDVAPRRRVGLVGESGSGKSLTAAAIMGMLPPQAVVDGGRIDLDGLDLVRASERQMRRVRGTRLSVVFQHAKASLNPVLTVGSQIAEVLRIHKGLSRRESHEGAVDLLRQMGIPNPQERAREYAHQYSGGMAQRATLALTMACSPDLLIADEPTTGLDVTVEEQVLELLTSEIDARGASLLFISHDLGAVARICDDVVVLYAGMVMESGPAERVLKDPRNPYTRELLRCFDRQPGQRLHTIEGQVPTITTPHTRCPFTDRCPSVGPECHSSVPQLREMDGRKVACHRV
ncbi:ABC transporter ATP-binding protein [Egibacter rhizosphaerae]|nr:ABC transporter ATP-binding protein [Egibacter rhizosphaerae]